MAHAIKQVQMDASGKREFKVWYTCSTCEQIVELVDRFCRWCGVELELVD